MLKRYGNLWKKIPGAMILAHIFVAGTAAVAVFSLGASDRELVAVGAFLVILLLALVPACIYWDWERRRR